MYRIISFEEYNASIEVQGRTVYTNPLRNQYPNARVSLDQKEVIVTHTGPDDGNCMTREQALDYILENWPQPPEEPVVELDDPDAT